MLHAFELSTALSAGSCRVPKEVTDAAMRLGKEKAESRLHEPIKHITDISDQSSDEATAPAGSDAAAPSSKRLRVDCPEMQHKNREPDLDLTAFYQAQRPIAQAQHENVHHTGDTNQTIVVAIPVENAALVVEIVNAGVHFKTDDTIEISRVSESVWRPGTVIVVAHRNSAVVWSSLRDQILSSPQMIQIRFEGENLGLHRSQWVQQGRVAEWLQRPSSAPLEERPDAVPLESSGEEDSANDDPDLLRPGSDAEMDEPGVGYCRSDGEDEFHAEPMDDPASI